jgi:heptosyltransferase-3
MRKRHITIIRPGALGDSLLTFPIMRALKNAQPSHITFVSNAAVLPLAQAWGVADVVYDYSDPCWSELFADQGIQSPVLQTLFANCDLIICWLRDPDGVVQHNLNAIAIGQIIVAPGRPAEGQCIHIVDYLAQTIGLSDVVKMEPMSRASERVSPTVYGLITHSGYGRDDPLTRPALFVCPGGRAAPLAIHPGSGGARKCWPISSFAELIQRLWQQAIPVLLLGGPADHERIAALQQMLPAPEVDMLTMLLDAPLLEVAMALQACRGYIGNDSGITHLAAMTGIPVVALFGPSDPVVWRPVGPHVTILYETVLNNLPVERVWQATQATGDSREMPLQ